MDYPQVTHLHPTTTLEVPLLLRYKLTLIFPYLKAMIDADIIDKWLNLLEGYFSVHDFSNREKITFSLLKVPHMSRTGGKPTVNKREE
jgi:hypothetical protein